MEKRTILRLRDYTCIVRLEDTLLLRQGDEPFIKHTVDQTARELFGITENDTLFEEPENYESLLPRERAAIDAAYSEYEDAVETGDHLPDIENAAVLLRLGVDFSNDWGFPLRCKNLLCRVAEFAAKGIKGKLPDPETLSRERDTFMKGRR